MFDIFLHCGAHAAPITVHKVCYMGQINTLYLHEKKWTAYTTSEDNNHIKQLGTLFWFRRMFQ